MNCGSTSTLSDESTVSAYAPERPLLPGTPDVRLEDQTDASAAVNQVSVHCAVLSKSNSRSQNNISGHCF